MDKNTIISNRNIDTEQINENSNLTKREKIKNNITELILSSTSHGLPSVFRTERIFFKIMWFIFFLISLSIGLWTIINSILDYTSYAVVTQTDIIYEIPTQFPTVTFYNLKTQKTNYTLEEILISCTFDDEPCYASDFETSENKIFKFNSGKNSSNQPIPFKTSALPGKESGLRLEIFAGLPKDDVPKGRFNRYDGFHVVVHNYTVDPRFHDGLDISPGFAFNLVASRTFLSKLDMPYNDCILNPSSEESHDSDIFKYMLNSRNYTYRHVDCYDYCLGLEMKQNCNLTELDSFEIIYDKYSEDEVMIACLDRVFEEFFIKNVYEVCHPHCPLECESISFGITTSFSKFPNLVYYEILLNNTQLTSKFPDGHSVTYEEMENSIVAFNVYYDDLKFTTISEVAKTSAVDLISNMGGLLGLFIGVSFLSFGELVEMALEVVFILFEKDSSKVSTKR